MVGTRRRSVNPTLAAESSEPSPAKSTPRGKNSAKLTDKNPGTPVLHNKRVDEIKASPRATRQRVKSPVPAAVASNVKDEDTSATSTPNKRNTSTPRGRKKATDDSVVESSNAEVVKQELEVKTLATRSRSPQKTTQTKPKEATLRPGTPTRSKRLSETEPRPETPVRGKRISESEARPSTPSRLKVDTLPLTPSRRSRRLSGSCPERVDSPVVPLKKRRSSLLMFNEDEESKGKESSLAVIEESTVEPENNRSKKVDIPDIVVENVDEAKADMGKEPVETSTKEEKTTVAEQKEVSKESVETAMEEESALEENKENKSDDSKLETKDKQTTEKHVDSEKNTDQKKEIVKKVIDEEARLLELIRNQILVKKIPRQKPKSGKFWKAERDQFRQIKKDKGPRKTFEERMRLKEEKQRNNEMASMVLQEKIARKQELRQRIEENKKAKEQRQLKSEVYQIVKNPNKIKRMKKKDLAKRDLLGKI